MTKFAIAVSLLLLLLLPAPAQAQDVQSEDAVVAGFCSVTVTLIEPAVKGGFVDLLVYTGTVFADCQAAAAAAVKDGTAGPVTSSNPTFYPAHRVWKAVVTALVTP